MKRVLFLATFLMVVLYGASAQKGEGAGEINLGTDSCRESDASAHYLFNIGEKINVYTLVGVSATAISTMVPPVMTSIMTTTRLTMRNIFIPVQRTILMMPKIKKMIMGTIIQRRPTLSFST